MKTELFCTACNKATDHAASVAKNGELDFTCGCGSFVRTALGTPEEVSAFISRHNAHNQVRKPLPTAADHSAALARLRAAGVLT